LQDKGSEMVDGKITLAGYAAVNEFGSENGHVPERSFLRSTVDSKQGEYQKALDDATGEMIDETIHRGITAGVRKLQKDLGSLGVKASGDVKTTIREIREPANAPGTLAKKYPADNPLIHTGRMRQSISSKVDMDGGK